MTKRRPVIVVSPRFRERYVTLCCVVPFSTTSPGKVMPYHHKLIIDPVFAGTDNAPFHWAKADMLYTVSLRDCFWSVTARTIKAGGYTLSE